MRGRSLTLVAVLMLVATTSAAEPKGSGLHGQHQDLFIEVPLDGYDTGVVFPFGGSHHTVPGVVAVDHAPYFCTPHARPFRERAAFVAHLRTAHHLADADIPNAVLVERNQVRYVGK